MEQLRQVTACAHVEPISNPADGHRGLTAQLERQFVPEFLETARGPCPHEK